MATVGDGRGGEAAAGDGEVRGDAGVVTGGDGGETAGGRE